MGFGFRLNIKWGFRIQPHFLTTSPSKISSSPARSKEACFNSARLSFLSTICEEDEYLCKDTLKAYTCSCAAPQVTANDLPEIEEMQINSRKRSHGQSHYMINRAEIPIEEETSHSSLKTGKASQFSMLMENLDVLEETFTDSDVLSLERDILLELGRIGALKIFNTSISRSLESSSLLDLSDALTESIEDQETDKETDRHVDCITVHSGKRRGRKSSRERASQNTERVVSLSRTSNGTQKELRKQDVSSLRNAHNRKRKRIIARNEAELSSGVKVIANLERIRKALEKETGQVASLSCWAEAAGIDEKELRQHLQFGLSCQDELIRSARSLILFLARNYRSSGMSTEDLLQAGRIGVLQGAERFDHTRGYKFSTYVQYWIRKSMLKMVAQLARGIQVPCALSRAINQIQKARKGFNNSNKKYPNDDEIAKVTGLSLAKIRAASNCLRIVGSIDQKMGEGLNVRYMEFTPDKSIKSPEETVMRKQMRDDIINLLEGLDARERKVLMLRYGFKDYQPKSLDEIGKLFHVSKEWVRKIEKKALTKLRDNKETTKNLGYYLDS